MMRSYDLIVIGVGFLAMEFAHIAKRAGARDVTVLEKMGRATRAAPVVKKRK